MASTLSKKRLRKTPASKPATTRPARRAAGDAHLKAVVKEALREVLAEELGDPDEGLEVRPEILARLRRQDEEFAAGQRGRPFEDVVKEMGLE
ncbi:MAG: hypothetical protein HY782_07900 [Chloroflexi bacterium]|nr:hypothetical protein [Chloroflexota bacterium]